jgi:thiol-disulfide isomerase/thioredoxin
MAFSSAPYRPERESSQPCPHQPTGRRFWVPIIRRSTRASLFEEGKGRLRGLMGTWCIQCVAEMTTVQKLDDPYRNDPNVSFLVISRLDSPATVRYYARLHHYDLPFYTMNDEDIPSSMRLEQFPSTFLYARDGSVAAQHTGAADWSAPRVTAFIETLKQN